jgi:molybdenum cofactor cytidylyltransferase
MSDTPVIAAIVLAGGSSKRFGADNKLLAEIDGRPLVARILAAIEEGGIARVVVVTGHQPDQVAAAVARAGRRITHNARYADGIGTSIAAGIAALDGDVDGALIAQGDMPAVDAALITTLCQCFADAGGDRIVFPVAADGRQGNPVVWPRRLFGALRQLGGDRGGKRLIEADGAAVVRVAVAGEAAAIDIDTPEELARYLAGRS